MRLDEFRVITCVSCGTTSKPLRKLPSMNSTMRACDPCLAKWGQTRLALIADQTLAGATPARYLDQGHCLHCGEPVLAQPTGGFPAWCGACENERRALLRG